MTNLDHLINKHREIDLEISSLQKRKAELMTDDEFAYLHKLKKKKLAIRDQIAALEEETLVA